MKKKTNGRLVTVLGIIILITALAYVGGSSMYTLIGRHVMDEQISVLFDDAGKNTRFASGKVYACTPEIVSIDHSVNFIPTGSEYYYVMVDTDGMNCMVIKAPKNWDKDYFPDFYNKEGVYVSGQVKDMKYDVKRAFASALEHFKMTGYNYSPDKYFDIEAEKNAIGGLLGFLSILFTAGLVLFLAKKKSAKPRRDKVLLALTVICAILGLVLVLRWFD